MKINFSDDKYHILNELFFIESLLNIPAAINKEGDKTERRPRRKICREASIPLFLLLKYIY